MYSVYIEGLFLQKQGSEVLPGKGCSGIPSVQLAYLAYLVLYQSLKETSLCPHCSPFLIAHGCKNKYFRYNRPEIPGITN